MSILHLIVRRNMTTRAPGRHAQRGCTMPPLLQEAAADIVLPAARADQPQRRGSAASNREQAAADAIGGRRARQ